MSRVLSSAGNLLFAEPSRVARRLLWYLHSIGSRRLTEPDHHGPFEKAGAHLFWIQSGEGGLEYEGRRFELHRGHNVWLVDMSKPRTYAPAANKHLTITGFRFGGPALELWHEQLRGDATSEFILDDFGFVRRTYTELLRLVRRRPKGWEWQVHLVVTHLLGKLLMSRSLLDSPQAELPVPVVRVLNAIAANPFRDWKAKELATVAKVSYSCLRALFHRTNQGTIHQQIQRVRLDQARLLLADERLSVKDVAAQLNFSSEFYFAHFFRHGAGMSPSEFRKHLKA